MARGVSALLSLMVAASATAQSTLEVPLTHATVQAAILAAADGDTVLVAPGTYRESLDFSGKSITVRSTAGPESTLLEPPAGMRGVAFVGGEGPETVFEGFTVSGGNVGARDGGALFCAQSGPTIRDCVFTMNRASSGGVLAVVDSPAMLIERCVFRFNRANGFGGAVSAHASNLRLEHCVFASNTAHEGGAVSLEGGSLTAHRCTFFSNAASSGGGALVLHGAPLTMTSCTIASNTADYGGATLLKIADPILVRNCLVAENETRVNGGTLSVIYSNAAFVGCTIAGNTSAQGSGSVWGFESTIGISNAIVWNNSSPQMSVNPASTLTVASSNVEGGWTGSGNVATDPLFQGIGVDGYRLAPASPCIDAGDLLQADAAEFDFEGDPRVVGNGVDIGADEYTVRTGDPLDRERPDDLRVMSYNVHQDSIFPTIDPLQAARFARIVTALQPDVITLQELVLSSAVSAVNLMNGLLPLPGGGTWYGYKALDCVTLSRYPLSMTSSTTIPAGERPLAMALVDLPDLAYPFDLYVMNTHYICCGGTQNDPQRQRQSDAIVAWMREARTAGGSFTLPAGTPMIVAGDLNLDGGARPRTTLVNGDIFDEATYGPDTPPDWDGSTMADAHPVHNGMGSFAYTWRDAPSGREPRRLDHVIYTDSVLHLARHYVLNTLALDGAQLAAAGLQRHDVTLGPVGGPMDHLPVIADFRRAPSALPGSGEDLLLRSTVGTAGNPFATFHTAAVGDLVSVTMDSPGTTFVGSPALLLGHLFPTGAPPGPVPHLAELHVDPLQSVILHGNPVAPLGVPLLPPGGTTVLWAAPPGLGGMTLRLQAGAVSAGAANGLFALSDAQDILF